MADGKITIDTKIDQSGVKQGTKKLEKGLQRTAKKAQKIGGNMTKYLTAPFVALGGAAFMAADDIDKAFRNIRVGTGATGDKLEDLKESFENVFTSVPESADQVSNALATVNTLTGATGGVLEDLTKSVLDASRSLGEDGVANADAFGKAMQQWQIPAEEGPAKLDKLFKATQDYGLGLGQISSHLTEYGSVLQNAGFNMDESADLFGRLEASGLKVSRVMPGLNMAFRNWSKEGKNSREEFQKIIQKMQEAETETEALAIATDQFGAEGAQRLTTAVRTGAIPALDELGGALEGTKGLVNDTTEDTKTVGEQFSELKNQSMMALQPLGEILLELARTALPPLIDAVTRLAEWFSNLPGPAQMIIAILGGLLVVLGPLLSMFSGLIIAVTALSSTVLMWGGIILGVVAIVAIIVVLVIKYWDQIKAFTIAVFTAIWDFLKMVWNAIWTTIKFVATAIWNGLKAIWNGIWNTIKAVITAIADGIKAVWNGIKKVTSTVWNGIKDFFVGLWDWFWDLFNRRLEMIKNIFSTVWNTIKKVTTSVWNGIKDFFSGIWDGIKAGAEKFKDVFLGIWEAIKSGIRAVVNPIVGIMNGLIGGIESMVNAISGAINGLPSFDIPSWVPVVGGEKFGLPNIPEISLPKIPSLDVGTNFVAQDGLAMLHKGEAVVPKEYNPAAGGGNKQPQSLTLYLQLGMNDFVTFVKDISTVQEREQLTLEMFRG
ncbi:phage tail tape measure protein [Salinibacillus xinjiangensis]|uniref:Phage tail tape measure protein n=1 Tax=Salinibacillus xinjiangensis TaxID=1229268 RepID=A0A6G1X877_9BACI|nr:phage tail tape measure protein [Salinibacillus xinjiangensis]MRG87008.1 phage tail tape measure protein [Salinibacillus xinjiangensis]